MAALRAKQQLDSPTVKVARLVAKEKSAREYRERNRGMLAVRAAHTRALARWAREANKREAIWLAMRQDHPGQPDHPVSGRKLYLICGKLVKCAGVYTSWASANAQYKKVPAATVKSYWDYTELRAVWHARCDHGEHDHPGISDNTHRGRNRIPRTPSTPSIPAPATSSSPASPTSSRLSRPLYWIHSHSCSPTLVSRTPSPTPPTPSPSHGAPPPYVAIG
ncbi:hypothetical protein B0H14DRAFT_2594209 [Mycena olivaceomarginata]|nr:hypothetical protein B0H14DRAFT_2594209 [Mycena olivaceomarginata]